MKNNPKPFPSDLEEKRLNLWKKIVIKAPTAYDGDIIRMLGFSANSEEIVIETEVVKY